MGHPFIEKGLVVFWSLAKTDPFFLSMLIHMAEASEKVLQLISLLEYLQDKRMFVHRILRRDVSCYVGLVDFR